MGAKKGNFLTGIIGHLGCNLLLKQGDIDWWHTQMLRVFPGDVKSKIMIKIPKFCKFGIRILNNLDTYF